jgi:hypothetical protein
VVFREGAARLVGVDLSSAMIAKARERGLYDELHQSDLHDFLAGQRGLDLMLAADVLIYVGDLSRLFPLVAAALASEGRFAFSTEKGTGDGFRFLPSGHFQHGEAYVRRLAGESGLTVAECLEIPSGWKGNGWSPGSCSSCGAAEPSRPVRLQGTFRSRGPCGRGPRRNKPPVCPTGTLGKLA